MNKIQLMAVGKSGEKTIVGGTEKVCQGQGDK
jgi:hypothetical protein